MKGRSEWVPAKELSIGDVLVTRDGREVPVEAIEDSSEVVTVYNFRVADYHTYFVGCDEWGFEVWAHNAACTVHKTSDDLFEVRVNGEKVHSATSEFHARTWADNYAKMNGHTVIPELYNGPPAAYGPFWRTESSVQHATDIATTGELIGFPGQNFMASSIPKVRAYPGPLPKGERGFEFYTDQKPQIVPIFGGQAHWIGEAWNDSHIIRVIVTKNQVQ